MDGSNDIITARLSGDILWLKPNLMSLQHQPFGANNLGDSLAALPVNSLAQSP